MRKLPLLMALMLSACKMGPDYAMPELALPESWKFSSAQEKAKEQKLPSAWWGLFNDPVLTALEEEGLKANADIAIAAARVAEARGVLRLTDADLHPTLGAQGAAGRTSRSKEATTNGFASSSKPYNDFSVSAVLDYEIDLWGKLRRSSESARAQLLAEEANHDAVRLAVASDIATGYFNLLAIDAQIEVTENTITSRQGSFEYQQKQYEYGAANELTYRQAEAELATAQAALPALQQARVEQENALSILLGRSPRELMHKDIARGKPLSALPVPPVMPTDAPSTLLTSRPDIMVAEQQLISANAQIGVAKADYFPTLSLSTLLGLASSDIDRVLRSSARTWDAGASLAGPLVDFGRVGGNVAATQARKEQVLLNYQQVVRSAFGDAVNAMSAIQTSQARVTAQDKQVKAYEESLRVANLRYEAGYTNYLDLLDAQRNFYDAQIDSVVAMRDRLSATVTLYKALGGGWDAQTIRTP